MRGIHITKPGVAASIIAALVIISNVKSTGEEIKRHIHNQKISQDEIERFDNDIDQRNYYGLEAELLSSKYSPDYDVYWQMVDTNNNINSYEIWQRATANNTIKKEDYQNQIKECQDKIENYIKKGKEGPYKEAYSGLEKRYESIKEEGK